MDIDALPADVTILSDGQAVIKALASAIINCDQVMNLPELA